MTLGTAQPDALDDRQTKVAFFLHLSDELRDLSSADAIKQAALAHLAQYLQVPQTAYADIDPTGTYAAVESEWNSGAMPSNAGRHRLDDFGPAFIDDLKNGHTVAIDDVRRDPRTNAPGFLATFEAGSIHAILYVPLVRAGRLISLLAIHDCAPRAWHADDIQLAEEMLDRTAAIVERALAEEALRASHDTFRHLVENSPFGVYAVDADFRLVQVSAGAQKVFENVRPLIGRDFADVLRHIWPESFAAEAIGHFRRVLETGVPYHAPGTVETRRDVERVESYDWKVERLTLPDGRHGAVCHFYDLSERERYEAALRESEARLRMALEAGRAGIWESTPATGDFIASEAALALHGLPPDTPLTQEVALAAIHPDDRASVVAGLHQALDAGTPFQVDLRTVHPDGSVRWLHSQADLRTDGEHARFVGLVQDITERKRNEEHVQILLREVNHRSKNMLSLVQAMARQTIAADKDQFIKRFGERLQALSAHQDLLISNEWRGIELGELLRSQLALFSDLVDGRVSWTGPPAALLPAAAQSIGMALHEMATNATKYGALSSPEGSIEVAWDIAGDRFRMSWNERNGPPVVPPQRTGFGSVVFTRLVTSALSASIEALYPESGFVWQMDCPASLALELDYRHPTMR